MFHLPTGVTLQNLHAHLMRKRANLQQEMETLRQRGHDLGIEIALMNSKIEQCNEALETEALKEEKT